MTRRKPPRQPATPSAITDDVAPPVHAPLPAPLPREPYRGPNRRAPDPPPSLTPTLVGVGMILGGFLVYVYAHHGGVELFPIVVMIVGAALIDPRAIRAAGTAMPWRRASGHTGEYQEPPR